MTPQRFPHDTRGHRSRRASAFSLVELLTVMFIISALIAILVPSLSAARNAAKKTVSKTALTSIAVGLETFKNENEKDFRRTNGYPPSFEHPKITGLSGFQPHLGQFPFLPSTTQVLPVVYGAHWLPAMLIGPDAQGYVQRSNVPKNLRAKPHEWYRPLPTGMDKAITRDQLYVDPGGINLIATKNLPGKRPSEEFFQDHWDLVKDMPVIADAFDYPVLYYVANRNGKLTNMVAEHRDETNRYPGDDQEKGVPFYFHEDNAGFTGTEDDEGWNFQGVDHSIRDPGHLLTGVDLVQGVGAPPDKTFARWIVDRNILKDLELKEPGDRRVSPLRPVRHETYILISPGVDGKYGTNDDISNIPNFIE